MNGYCLMTFCMLFARLKGTFLTADLILSRMVSKLIRTSSFTYSDAVWPNNEERTVSSSSVKLCLRHSPQGLQTAFTKSNKIQSLPSQTPMAFQFRYHFLISLWTFFPLANCHSRINEKISLEFDNTKGKSEGKAKPSTSNIREMITDNKIPRTLLPKLKPP